MPEMPDWYQIRAKADEEDAEIILYGEIGGMWDEEIGAKEFRKEALALNGYKRIHLRVNSPGGSVFQASAIYQTIRELQPQTLAHIDGIAASAMSMIIMGADEVIMPEGAMIMIHDPSACVMGTAYDMRFMADALEKVRDGLVSAYERKTGLARARIIEMMKDETWLTSDEAIALGFADSAELDAGSAEDSAPVTGFMGGRQHNSVNSMIWNSWASAQKPATPQPKRGNVMSSLENEKYTRAELDTLIDKAVSDALANQRKDESDIVSTAVEAAVMAERKRIEDIEDIAVPGYEQLVNAAKFSDPKSAQELAVIMMRAEKNLRTRVSSGIKADEAALPKIDASLDGSALPSAKKDTIRGRWDKDGDLRAEFAEFEDFEAAVKVGDITLSGVSIQ